MRIAIFVIRTQHYLAIERDVLETAVLKLTPFRLQIRRSLAKLKLEREKGCDNRKLNLRSTLPPVLRWLKDRMKRLR